jgi:hypothetical protein
MKVSRKRQVLPAGVVIPTLVTVLGLVAFTRAATPHIDIIEPYVGNQVLIHFNIEANHTHTLQRCTSFIQTSNGLVGDWTNILTIDPLPFNDHWVAVDTNTTLPVRFYRLMVTPR